MIQGYIDVVGVRSVHGWAVDESGSSPRLRVFLNGSPCAEMTPDRARPDLRPLLGGDDVRHGFDVDVGRPLAVGDVVEVLAEDGRHLGQSPWSVQAVVAGRDAKALALIDRSMKVLEIGPSFAPLTPRSMGWNSFSLDHASQEELVRKYAGQQPVENIEPVDFIWKDGPISSVVPVEMHDSFDAIIASHVIEHFPDPIGFYLSAARLLKTGGLISLVVPDKRFMFDFFKPVSLTSDLLAAHAQGSTRHSKKVAFDNAAYNVFEQGEVAWSARPVGAFSFPGGDGTLQGARLTFDGHSQDESAPYVDLHHTIYVPSSFQLIILELGQLGVIPFEIAVAYPAAGCEFFVTLRKGSVEPLAPAVLAAERLRLMRQTIVEQAEQAAWMTTA